MASDLHYFSGTLTTQKQAGMQEQQGLHAKQSCYAGTQLKIHWLHLPWVVSKGMQGVDPDCSPYMTPVILHFPFCFEFLHSLPTRGKPGTLFPINPSFHVIPVFFAI